MTAHKENYAEMFHIHLRRLLEDTVRCHSTTSAQALRCVVLSQIPPQLCSKATSHALDRVPGSSRVTLIYKLHIQAAYTDRNYHGDNIPTPQCKTCTLPRSAAGLDLLHCKEHTVGPRLPKDGGHRA